MFTKRDAAAELTFLLVLLPPSVSAAASDVRVLNGLLASSPAAAWVATAVRESRFARRLHEKRRAMSCTGIGAPLSDALVRNAASGAVISSTRRPANEEPSLEAPSGWAATRRKRSRTGNTLVVGQARRRFKRRNSSYERDEACQRWVCESVVQRLDRTTGSPPLMAPPPPPPPSPAPSAAPSCPSRAALSSSTLTLIFSTALALSNL
mmetsp:Transcript_5079/g.11253  ORF Transcript_5079/g.11253 Transcript_5079/m.11253 type:complete len:208 (-) Transcript_5079:108-731(-)